MVPFGHFKRQKTLVFIKKKKGGENRVDLEIYLLGKKKKKPLKKIFPPFLLGKNPKRVNIPIFLILLFFYPHAN